MHAATREGASQAAPGSTGRQDSHRSGTIWLSLLWLSPPCYGSNRCHCRVLTAMVDSILVKSHHRGTVQLSFVTITLVTATEQFNCQCHVIVLTAMYGKTLTANV